MLSYEILVFVAQVIFSREIPFFIIALLHLFHFMALFDHLSNFNLKGSSVFCSPSIFSFNLIFVIFVYLKSLFLLLCLT